MDTVVYPADRFMRSLYVKEETRKYNDWLQTFPANFFTNFMEDGLKPFLKYHGYELGFSVEKRASYCMRWAYSYSKNPGEEVEFTKWMHTGILEDYEWYLYKIPQEKWNEFMNNWMTLHFLDDSDIGHKQRNDMVRFIWQCIDLSNSRQYNNFLDFMYENDETDENNNMNNEENNTYGGDRRTY